MSLINVKRAASVIAATGIAATGLTLSAGVASAEAHNEFIKQYPGYADCGPVAVSETFRHRSEGWQYYCAQNDKGYALWVRIP